MEIKYLRNKIIELEKEYEIAIICVIHKDCIEFQKFNTGKVVLTINK